MTFIPDPYLEPITKKYFVSPKHYGTRLLNLRSEFNEKYCRRKRIQSIILYWCMMMFFTKIGFIIHIWSVSISSPFPFVPFPNLDIIVPSSNVKDVLESKRNTRYLYIDEKGTIVYNHMIMDSIALSSHVFHDLCKRPRLTIAIVADKETRMETINTVLNSLRISYALKVKFITQIEGQNNNMGVIKSETKIHITTESEKAQYEYLKNLWSD
jgi:biopolymer transport protein ExbD